MLYTQQVYQYTINYMRYFSFLPFKNGRALSRGAFDRLPGAVHMTLVN